MRNLAEIELAGERIARGLIPTNDICGDDETDTQLLRKMADDARQHVASFSWCGEVLDSYFGGGFGGIFAVFFFHIRPTRPEAEPWIWAIVGDIPNACLPVTDCESPAEAFRIYFHGMSKWVELARKGEKGTQEQGIPPVNLPSTPEWAEKIAQRLHGLTLTVKSLFENAEEDPGMVQ